MLRRLDKTTASEIAYSQSYTPYMSPTTFGRLALSPD